MTAAPQNLFRQSAKHFFIYTQAVHELDVCKLERSCTRSYHKAISHKALKQHPIKPLHMMYSCLLTSLEMRVCSSSYNRRQSTVGHITGTQPKIYTKVPTTGDLVHLDNIITFLFNNNQNLYQFEDIHVLKLIFRSCRYLPEQTVSY